MAAWSSAMTSTSSLTSKWCRPSKAESSPIQDRKKDQRATHFCRPQDRSIGNRSRPGKKESLMQNPAPTSVPIHDILLHRWSPRAFSDKPVSPEILHALFEAARWAPSSSNYQPWAYIVGTKESPDDFAKILSTLVEFNAGWAQNAPVLVMSVAQVKVPKDGSPNRHAFHDVGSASAQLTFEANARGLLVHQMAG